MPERFEHVTDTLYEDAVAQPVPITLTVRLPAQPQVLKRKWDREIVQRHWLEDAHAGVISIIEKTYFQPSLPIEYLVYRALPTRGGRRWRMPDIYCLRRGQDFHSIFMEDVKSSGYATVPHEPERLRDAAEVVGRMNRTLALNARIRKKVPEARLPREFFAFGARAPLDFPDFIDPATSRRAVAARHRLHAVLKAQRKLHRRMPFLFAHGDVNRANLVQHKRSGDYLLLDWALARFLPACGDLSQLLFGSFWGYSPFGREKAPRDGASAVEVEPLLIAAYLDGLRLDDIGAEECSLGLDLTTVKYQFNERLPKALRHMKPPQTPQEEERMAQIQANLEIMSAKVESVCDRLERLPAA